MSIQFLFLKFRVGHVYIAWHQRLNLKYDNKQRMQKGRSSANIAFGKWGREEEQGWQRGNHD